MLCSYGDQVLGFSRKQQRCRQPCNARSEAAPSRVSKQTKCFCSLRWSTIAHPTTTILASAMSAKSWWLLSICRHLTGEGVRCSLTESIASEYPAVARIVADYKVQLQRLATICNHMRFAQISHHSHRALLGLIKGRAQPRTGRGAAPSLARCWGLLW